MDILKRIDQAQQFCNFYADGAYSVETEKWNYHVNPEFIEDIRQYIESLQLKLMHLQTQQAHKDICKEESYDMIDRFLRNNLYDDDYESYSEALYEVATTSTTPRREWRGLTEEEIRDLWSWSATSEAERTATTQQHAFARAIEAALRSKNHD